MPIRHFCTGFRVAARYKNLLCNPNATITVILLPVERRGKYSLGMFAVIALDHSLVFSERNKIVHVLLLWGGWFLARHSAEWLP